MRFEPVHLTEVTCLADPGAQVRQRALFVASAQGHIDNHTRFDHRAPHGTSRETVRGLARDSARGVFNGKIVVHPGAQKTDSEQRIANLILSPGADTIRFARRSTPVIVSPSRADTGGS